jgi:Uma2 family endonuclease
MSSAERYIPHYNINDYRQWKGDWELIKGVPISMTPSPFGRHQALAASLTKCILDSIEAANCDAYVLPETDWIISDDTVVRPDISVVCGEIPERHIESAPTLVCEILSPSTQDRDLNYKRELYLENGVATYLVADPDSKEISVATKESRELALVSPSQAIQICEHCAIELELAGL